MQNTQTNMLKNALQRKLQRSRRVSINALMTGITAITLSACGSSGTETDSNTVNTNDTSSGGSSASSLAGTWDRCLGGIRFTYEFTDSRWADTRTVYQTPDCSGEPAEVQSFEFFNFEGSYEFVGNTTSDEGLSVRQMNLTSDTFNGVGIISSSMVTQYTILYTGTQNQLVVGEFTSSEAGRPTQLDFENPFLRR